jgi:NADPH-dependent 2,4-dienoyl-CoA reductase/sulfur reductase-like enzyme
MNADPAPGIVIVGAGHAGFQLAASLRQDGHDGRIVLVDSQDALPYQRPPLSKAYLKGDMPLETLGFRREAFYGQHAIERVTAAASEIDRGSRRLLLEDGTALAYSHLVLAPGARNRPLAVPGADGPGVAGIRTLRDADYLRERMAGAPRIAVVGAGFIGLEFAAVAAAAGARVDVVELALLPMSRALAPDMAKFFMAHHERSGVRFHTGRGVREITRGPDGAVTGLVLSDGEPLESSLVVFGIGVVPNVELAQSAGLACDNGIVVDDELLTEDPCISAIGDAVNFPAAQGRMRLESVQNAVDQARHVSARLARGPRGRYDAVPWFWSEQGSLRLQIAGLSYGHDATLVTGSPEAGKFSVLCFGRGLLQCVESVNSPADHMAARKILAGPERPRLDEAGAPGFTLKAWTPVGANTTAAAPAP